MIPRIHNRLIIGALLLLITGAGALAFRLPQLTLRPMHTDEAVHAVKVGQLLGTGAYIYNPHEYHGPTPYYASLPFVWLSGARSFMEMRDEVPLRIVPALFGAGLILLLLLLLDGLGPRASVCAGILTAVSPAMVFYSRYYIQEMLLVFFALGTIGCAWRYTRDQRLSWALLGGLFVGLMHATKETCVILYAAMLGGAALTMLWSRWIDGHHLRVRDYVHHWHAVGAIKVAAVVAIVVLTGFLSNPSATVDALRTYAPYLERAGSGDSSMGDAALHNYPWHFYLKMLMFFKAAPGPWWSEGLILALGLTGIGMALMRKRNDQLADAAATPSIMPSRANTHLRRFLAFYTLLTMAVFSLIPYKTPWNMLVFLHGLILMSGVGAVSLIDRLRHPAARMVAVALLAAGVLNLGQQAWRANFVYYADTRNPYVYAHTSTNYLDLVQRMEDLATVDADGYGMLVKVMAPGSDYWPLPWDLRRFENVGFWNEIPDDAAGAVVIAKTEFEGELDSRLGDNYMKEYFGLRPEVLLVVYIRQSLWNAFIETRKNS